MTATYGMKKAPVAELGGTRDEGLNPTSHKKQENTIMTRKCTPAQWAAGKIPQVHSVRVALEDGYADIDLIAPDHIELSARIGDRALVGLVLSADEAERIGEELLAARRRDPEGDWRRDLIGLEVPVSDLASGTVDDLFECSAEAGVAPGIAVTAVKEYVDAIKVVAL